MMSEATYSLYEVLPIFSRGENVGHRTIFDIGDNEHPRLDITLSEEIGSSRLSLQPGLGVTKAEDIMVE